MASRVGHPREASPVGPRIGGLRRARGPWCLRRTSGLNPPGPGGGWAAPRRVGPRGPLADELVGDSQRLGQRFPGGASPDGALRRQSPLPPHSVRRWPHPPGGPGPPTVEGAMGVDGPPGVLRRRVLGEHLQPIREHRCLEPSFLGALGRPTHGGRLRGSPGPRCGGNADAQTVRRAR